MDIYFDQVKLVENGLACGPQAEEAATQVLQQEEIELTLDLKTGGTGQASLLTCDLTLEYIKINADYRS